MKNGKLNGKVAVVTGASKGIGAGIARQFAAEGAAVVVNYASSKEGADRVVDEISKRGGKAIAVQGDVAKKKDIERLFAEAKKSFGRIDILVNNAGAYDFKPLEEVTETEFHREFNTNVLGLLLATQEAAKHFSADGGSVINVSSVASSATPPHSAIYTATKGAVDAITRVWRKSSGREKSASTRSIQARLKLKAFTPSEFREAILRNKWSRRRRLVASDNRETSHRWLRFWLPRNPNGSPAKPSASQADFANRS